MSRFFAWLDAPGAGLPILAALLLVVLVLQVWSRRTEAAQQQRALQGGLPADE